VATAGKRQGRAGETVVGEIPRGFEGASVDSEPSPGDYALLERRVREACDAGDAAGAATLFLRHCGGDILSFLAGRMHGDPEASEVFACFSEDFWRGLPGFRWQTSLRSWAYTLARHATFRHEAEARRRRRRFEPLSSSSRHGMEVARLHSATRRYLRTEFKQSVRRLREQLSADDQTLLVLRVDRRLSWKELAGVLSGKGEQLRPAERVRWAARLRKRFQFVKTKLRALARAEGLLR
jgi:RNA polymerase sigma-70 factor (ECF subfamily)